VKDDDSLAEESEDEDDDDVDDLIDYESDDNPR
jgi:hypothetical protein